MEEPSSDRQQWQRVFHSLTQILQSQQSQIETLASDRHFLQNYIHLQHANWSTKCALLHSQIQQMEKAEKKQREVQEAKMDVMVGLQQQEALRFKNQFELAESDLDDFYASLEALVAEVGELKEKLKGEKPGTPRTGVGDSTTLELQKLKHSYKKLTLEKDSQVSALLSEKDFVWNQLKRMENDYSGLIKAKRTEVQQVNEALEKLQTDLEHFQSSVNEKSEIISRLEVEREKLELDVRRHKHETEKANEKMEKLQHEIEKLNLLVKEKDEVNETLRNKLVAIQKDLTSSNNKSRFRSLGSQRDSKCASVTPLASQPKREKPRSFRRLILENGDTNKKTSTSASACVSEPKNYGRRMLKSGNTNMRTVVHAGADVSEPQNSHAVSALQLCSKEKQKRPASPAETPRLFSANFKVPKLKSPASRPSNLTV